MGDRNDPLLKELMNSFRRQIYKYFAATRLYLWNCGREVRHLIVDQADDGSSPFSSAMHP